MENVIEWNVGLNGFKKCTLELGEKSHNFTTELLDNPFEYGRNITVSIAHIKWNNTIKTLLNTQVNENDKFN